MTSNLFVLALMSACLLFVAATDDETSNLELPSLMGMLGSKSAVADTMYDDYEEDDDSSDSSDDSSDDVADALDEAPNAPCCFPNVWQGRLKSDFGFVRIGGGRGGKSSDDDKDSYKKKKKHQKKGGKGDGSRPISSHSVDMVYVDGARQRLAGRKVECHGEGKSLNVSYIFLLGANRTGDLYLFDVAAQKCRYRQLKGVDWRRQCLPANATLRGQYSLGPATGGLKVQSWSFAAGPKRSGDDGMGDLWSPSNSTTTTHRPRPRPRPGPRMFIAANVLVVPGSCTPVVIQEEGVIMSRGSRDFGSNNYDVSSDDDSSSQDNEDDFDNFLGPKPTQKPRPRPKPRGEGFIGSIYFTGVQPSISDPSVFTVPSYCKKSPNTLYYDEMEDEIPAVVERFLVL